QSVVAAVCDDADDLPRLLGGEFAHDPLADDEAVVERIGVLPVLLRHRLVDDDDGLRRAIVANVERASAADRNPEHLEIVRRYGHPSAAAVIRTGLQRAADDRE